MSVFVVGELLHGFRRGSFFDRNSRELDDFLSRPRVRLLPATFETADRFSRIAAQLRKKGRPIPTNDIWIAAHAMETGAELISYDEDFAAVDGLAWTHPTARVGDARGPGTGRDPPTRSAAPRSE